MRTYPSVDRFISLTTLDALPEAAMIYRGDGLLVGYNGAAERLYGVPREAVLDRFNVLETPEILDEAIVAAIKAALGGRPGFLPVGNVDVSKSAALSEISQKSVWSESSFTPLRDAEGEVAYVIILVHDMTALREERVAVARARAEIEEQHARLGASLREIEEQRATILALETPVIEVSEGILTLPVIGAITERRAADMMSKALSAVSAARARYLILDLTGSDLLDTPTVAHFSAILRAVALLGARGIIVGIRPQVAQTMISLGLDLSGAQSHRNLREALAHCTRENAPSAG